MNTALQENSIEIECRELTAGEAFKRMKSWTENALKTQREMLDLATFRFLLFEGHAYEEAGGANDLVGIYSSLPMAKRIAENGGADWAHIFDLMKGRIVARWSAENAYGHNEPAGWEENDNE